MITAAQAEKAAENIRIDLETIKNAFEQAKADRNDYLLRFNAGDDSRETTDALTSIRLEIANYENKVKELEQAFCYAEREIDRLSTEEYRIQRISDREKAFKSVNTILNNRFNKAIELEQKLKSAGKAMKELDQLRLDARAAVWDHSSPKEKDLFLRGSFPSAQALSILVQSAGNIINLGERINRQQKDGALSESVAELQDQAISRRNDEAFIALL
mgnify:CR=1 FL=1